MKIHVLVDTIKFNVKLHFMMTPLLAGIARRDITPSAGTQLLGYPQQRFGNEIADALNVTALVLQSGDNIAVIISLDLSALDEVDVARLREKIALATGIAPLNITLCPTHTHSGPVTLNAWGWGEKNQEYLQALVSPVVQAVQESLAQLQPCRIGFGVCPTDVGINRREIQLDGEIGGSQKNEWGPRDRDLTVVRFEGNNGTITSLVHLGAHPTARGLHAAISRDWPGVMMDRVEQVTGAPVLFINGAYGDIGPRTAIQHYVGDGVIAAQEVGLRAASDALRAWRNIKELRHESLRTLSETFELPHAPLPTNQEACCALEGLGDQQGKLGASACDWYYWNAVIRANETPFQPTRAWQQTLTAIGPLVIVPFAGEIFSEIALRCKQHSPYAHTLCAGNTNGADGYYVTREARARGGYEPWVARNRGAYLLADNIDDFLVQANIGLLNRLVTS